MTGPAVFMIISGLLVVAGALLRELEVGDDGVIARGVLSRVLSALTVVSVCIAAYLVITRMLEVAV